MDTINQPDKSQLPPEKQDQKSLKSKLTWFITIWVLSVAALGALSYALKLVLNLAY